VILDNLGSHRAKAVRRIVRDAGGRLVFLQKCSPYLNPIEQVFAKLNPTSRIRPRHKKSLAGECLKAAGLDG